MPDLDQFLLNMFSLLSSPESQLDYASSFKPPSCSAAAWDRRVNDTVWRAYFMVVTAAG